MLYAHMQYKGYNKRILSYFFFIFNRTNRNSTAASIMEAAVSCIY